MLDLVLDLVLDSRTHKQSHCLDKYNTRIFVDLIRYLLYYILFVSALFPKGNLNSNFITRRKYHLEQFLENLICWRDNDPDVVAFLGIDERVCIERNLDNTIISFLSLFM